MRLKLHAVAVVACALFVVIGVTMMSVALPRAAATDDLFTRYFALLGPLMIVIAVVVPITEARKAARILATLFQSEPSRSVSERRVAS